MADFSIEWDDARLQKLAHPLFGEAMEKVVELTAMTLWRNLGIESPVKKGKLQGSWRVTPAGRLRWHLGSTTKYRWFVNDGTRPHIILPTRKRALSFSVNGQKVTVKRVNHPGTKPNPYIPRAIARTHGESHVIAAQVLRSIT